MEASPTLMLNRSENTRFSRIRAYLELEAGTVVVVGAAVLVMHGRVQRVTAFQQIQVREGYA